MRVIQLSDHPGDLLRQERQQRVTGAGPTRQQHPGPLARRGRSPGPGRPAAGRAPRAGRRWLTWLRAVLATRRPRSAAPGPAAAVHGREQSIAAGTYGEQLTADELGRVLGDDWTLLRGYRNRRGEIDHLLIGPGGLFAIESKYHNAAISCTGDGWWSAPYDKYGNRVGPAEPLTDRRGRSPSQQLNQPADELEDFLRSRGHPAVFQRVVLLNHPRVRLGTCTSPTVGIATSARQILGLARRSPGAVAATDLTEVERLIVRDHRHHAARRSPGPRPPAPARRPPAADRRRR
jgi:hypothetical protein